MDSKVHVMKMFMKVRIKRYKICLQSERFLLEFHLVILLFVVYQQSFVAGFQLEDRFLAVSEGIMADSAQSYRRN